MEEEKKPNNLSASLIKYMMKSPTDFRIKFCDLYIRPYELFIHMILGNAIHKVAEKYTLTWEWDEQLGMDYIYAELALHEIGEVWDEEAEYTMETVLEMEQWYKNALKGLREVKSDTGLPEQKITLPFFNGYVDLIKGNEIIDYKTVGKFIEHKEYNPDAPYDSKSGYIIQLALYAYWYHTNYWEYPVCKIIEILKKPTEITVADIQYVKKDLICDLIAQQYDIDVSSFRTDRKMTRERLVEEYPINKPRYNIYQIEANEEFIELGKNLYEISVSLRQNCLDRDMEAFKENHKKFKKICISKIKKITNEEAAKYKSK